MVTMVNDSKAVCLNNQLLLQPSGQYLWRPHCLMLHIVWCCTLLCMLPALCTCYRKLLQLKFYKRFNFSKCVQTHAQTHEHTHIHKHTHSISDLSCIIVVHVQSKYGKHMIYNITMKTHMISKKNLKLIPKSPRMCG